MDLQDLFETKNQHQHYKKQKKKAYYSDDRYSHKNYYKSQGKFNPYELINSIKNNKKLKFIILFTLFVVLAVIIGLIILLFPLIANIFNYLSQNGVSGVIEMIMESLNKLWNEAAQI